MKKGDLKIGMSLFACMGVRGRYTGTKEYKILSIGTKYFYVDGLKEKFNIENLLYEEKDFSLWNIQLYLTSNEIEEMRLSRKLKSNIDDFFRWNKRKLSLHELKSIHSILFNNE
jgi:hypothetical protein